MRWITLAFVTWSVLLLCLCSSSCRRGSDNAASRPPDITADLDLGGTKGTITMSADCTDEACPPGVCCNTCGLHVHFYAAPSAEDDEEPTRHWDVVGHGCEADGCGKPLPCAVTEGPYTLPPGAHLQPVGSGFFHVRIGPPGGPPWSAR